MPLAKFNENGELVNPETGKVIGNKAGNKITINSNDAEMLSLEDYGVGLPEFPEEQHGRKDEDEDFGAQPSVAVNAADNVSVNVRDSVSVSDQLKTHADSGPTSYKVKRSKYEITKDSYFIVKFGLVQKDDGRFVPIKEEAVDGIPQAELHWVKFRMWNYGEELKWKSEFLEYNNVTKAQFLNIDKLNERKIRRLLLDWSFGEYDDRLKLLHCDGSLSDESYSMFMGLYPSIAGTIVDMMNLVLESNQ